jgi:hypothetical protein
MNSIITVLAGSREDEIAIRAVIVDVTDGFNNHDDGSTEPPHSELSIRGISKGQWNLARRRLPQRHGGRVV